MNNSILIGVYQIATGLHKSGKITDTTMREFDRLCLSPVHSLNAPVSHSKDPELQKAPRALMRASEKARLLAEQTGTTFVVRKSAKPAVAAKKRK